LDAESEQCALLVERHEAVCDRFDPKGVEILTPSNSSAEFVLGDVPAITVNHGTGAAGLAAGVAVDEADEIFMPFGPRLLVVVGGSSGARSIGDADVERYNRLEVRLARNRVFHRPGSNFALDIEAWRH
jgi:hypothetical protein